MISKRIICTAYLEGIKVNFNSIQITESAEAPPMAVVSFPADSAALTILPKTVLQVFYRDAWDTNAFDALIFMGELSGAGISFSGDKRSINLTFLGITQNWNTNILLPIDINISTMLDRALYCQINGKTSSDGTIFGSNVKFPSALELPWERVKKWIAKFESDNGKKKIGKNTNGTQDSGLYQINDIHLKQNGDKSLMRKDIDAVFVKYGLSGSTPLQEKRDNLINNDNLNEDVAKTIYAHKGIRAWSTRFKVLEALAKEESKLTDPVKRNLLGLPQNNEDTNVTSSQTIQFMNFPGMGVLDGLLSKIATNPLTVVLDELIQTFTVSYQGVYWAMLSKAFKVLDMVKIDNNKGIAEIEKLFKVTAVLEHLRNLAKGVPTGQPLATLLTTILSSMGLSYSEIAAPTYTGDKRIHVMIKPETHFFPPIKHNLVVDDNIAQLNFSRNFDMEPTRLVGETPPFYLTRQDEMTKAILAVVVPANIMLNQGIKTTIEKAKDYEDIKMFGLSPEEQCRGTMVSRYQDTTGIENAYLIASMPEKKDAPEESTTEPAPIVGDAWRQSEAFEKNTSVVADAERNSKMSAVQAYHMNVASCQYYNRRHAARTVQVNTPYSPYRMVGFPGVIVSKHLPPETPGIVGTVASISSSISADGNASQTIVFSHCRLMDESPLTRSSLGFMDDSPSQAIPWYAEYTNKNNINSFYEQFTGVSDSTVMDTSVDGDEGEMIVAEIRSIRDELLKIVSPGSTEEVEAYLLRKTKRPLVPMKVIDTIYPSNSIALRRLDSSPKVAYADSEIHPYVKERRDRVLLAFDTQS